jgi:excinuclease ABC subunit C
LHYLQRIRDEAHRFAIAFHKRLRGKRGLQTILDEIPGIGEVKKKALLRHFGGLAQIQEASLEALRGVESLNAKDAQTVYDFFHHRPTESWDADLRGGTPILKTVSRESARG